MTESSKPIRVCFVSPKSYPLFNRSVKSVFGGAEVDLFNIGTELAKDDNFQVSFVTADYDQDSIEQCQGVTIIKSLDFKQNSLVSAVKIYKALKKADADIYMIKTASVGTWLVDRFCKKHKKKFVYRTASMKESDGRYIKEHPVIGKFFSISLKNAGAIFTQNSEDRDNLQKTLGLDSVAVANGHSFGVVKSGEKKHILWVGRSEKVKGPEVFLDLVESMPAERFVMICQRATGDDGYERLVDRASDISNLDFYSQVDFHEIDGFFSGAKVLVNTSDSEGFANTFIQAARAGAAILTLNVNPDGFLDKYDCGLCCDGQKEKLRSVLAEMLRDDKYISLGENASSYARANHDIAVIIDRYKEVFRDLAGR